MHERNAFQGAWNASLCVLAGTQGQQIPKPGTNGAGYAAGQ